MRRIEFSQITNGLYRITDHNDERLLVIGRILLSDILRNAVKDALKDAPEIGLERHKEIKTEDYQLRISPKDETTIWFKLLTKSDPHRILEIDLRIPKILDIIDAWEDAVDAMPESITITREQDNYTLETL